PMKRIALSLSAALLTAATTGAFAQADAAKNYPDKPIRLIMPTAPGSANDTLARIVAIKLGEALGQQIIIDNRAGAGGVLGMEIGKNANPDGYTVVAASTAAMSIAPHIYRKLPYDPLNDYLFVSMFGVTPNLLVVNPSLPIKTTKELIDYAKANPAKFNMASAGPGSQSHLAGVYLQVKAGFESMHVPYKGGGASVASVVANESQWTITPAPAVMSLVNGGRLRAIGQSLPKRTPLLPDVPAVAETVPGFDYSGWNGLLLPKGTPRAIQDKLRAALIKAVESKEVKDAFTRQGADATTNTPQEFRALVADEIKNIGPVVKAAGLKVE
ncbi:MAG: Bug family tripartite tricarboxylate transporter substrate binding protein, partial [Burkholderiales bacterium]